MDAHVTMTPYRTLNENILLIIEDFEWYEKDQILSYISYAFGVALISYIHMVTSIWAHQYHFRKTKNIVGLCSVAHLLLNYVLVLKTVHCTSAQSLQILICELVF